MIKAAFNRFDILRLLALSLWALPMIALLPLGMLWLWQSEALFLWLIVLAICASTGYGLQYILLQYNRKLLTEKATQADPLWSSKAESSWSEIEQFAESIEPEEWSLSDGGRLWVLGRNTLEMVARHYHPKVEQPLLELTVPHTLLIIERASRDLRADVAENIPLSHQLTIGDLIRVWRWKASAERLLNVYRAGRLVVNPASALLSELWGHVRNEGYGLAWTELHRWLLREYVRKVGYYAISLYSGRLTLDEADPTAEPTSISQKDQQRAEAEAATGEPLRILVLGRANAGKSSLINALFGQLTTATDILPDTTTGLTSYRLERDGLETALISDTPGHDTGSFDWKTLKRQALEADLILWVCAAHRADRNIDRVRLDELRAELIEQPERHPPPILVAMSHIDQLRPAREWQPPYDLLNPQTTKAHTIQAALEAVALDLAIPVADVVPVCLLGARIYNVDDTLWAAILNQQNDAGKARFLRCLEGKKRAENWKLLRTQLANTGRWLLKLPGRTRA